MKTYRISQLAERSGVPPTTLRFYETAGLLPADRTPSGYRVYDEQSVDRLAFISSAKLLGLPLEEIRELLEVWEQGVCAAVRARMLPLVADRIADADQRLAELSAFSARLAEVCEQLSGTAPEGGCGPDCGCVTTTARQGPAPVELTPNRPARHPSEDEPRRNAEDEPRRKAEDEPWRNAPVACTLSGAELGERVGQWQRLASKATGREEIQDGVRLAFPAAPELAGEVVSLAAAEQDCCAFFDFTLHLAPTELVLTVRAPEAAGSLLAELFGATA
ncbi:MerR family transcriptional regulator [Streptomyces sp. PR69]|uniref:MerR family transcriptional regulator n=1 Tax=Streptomyces sp. PR69 TaxID=2984950 RepID=UPI0022646B29|nr:MerR family transcriptional regulator [Streptomyces sp. PR69]